MRLAQMGLLEACKSGDERAWRRLFEAQSDAIYRWAVLLGLGPADARDAAQEVLAVAVRRIDSCPGEEALSAWLFQITRRVVANVRRSRWWRLRWKPSAADEPAFEHATAGDAARELAIRTCLKTLPPAQAEVLLLMDLEGHTRDEVAQLLTLPAGTVASRLRLAREGFKAAWQHYERTRGALLPRGEDA